MQVQECVGRGAMGAACECGCRALLCFLFSGYLSSSLGFGIISLTYEFELCVFLPDSSTACPICAQFRVLVRQSICFTLLL